MNIRVILYCITTAFLANAVVAQVIVFEDNFNISDTDSGSVLTSPTKLSGRGTGFKQDKIKYSFSGGIVTAEDGTVSGATVSGQKLAFSLQHDGPSAYIRFLDVLTDTDIDFAPMVGDYYEVSYKAFGAWSDPLTFSISSEPQTGRYNADAKSEYDFGIRAWAHSWVIGEDGNNLYNGNDIDGIPGIEYSVRIVFDERVDDATTGDITEAAASVYIDNVLLDTYDIEFETDERYMQFVARDGYVYEFDDLTISSHSVPELSNTTLIFSLFALSICLSRRSYYSLRA